MWIVETIVLQSQRPDRLQGWQGRCCDSVQAWARRHGLAYRRCGDELFERVAEPLRQRFAAQPVVLSDLARLLWLQEVLDEGYRTAIWCDADVLLFRDFSLAPAPAADRVGRECWVQHTDGRLRSYRKVHNAWLQVGAGSAFLAFYIDRALALLHRARPPFVPQFLGPKLLTAWHNIVPFEVEERVGMLSPLAMQELLGRPSVAGPALAALRSGHAQPLCALNLSASCEGREVDGVCHGSNGYNALIDGLLGGAIAVGPD